MVLRLSLALEQRSDPYLHLLLLATQSSATPFLKLGMKFLQKHRTGPLRGDAGSIESRKACREKIGSYTLQSATDTSSFIEGDAVKKRVGVVLKEGRRCLRKNF